MDNNKLSEALKKDYASLYTSGYTTTWKQERILRNTEIDIMDFPNTLALFKAEVGKLKVMPDKKIYELKVDDPTLDMSFYDDYYDEVNYLLEAQLKLHRQLLLEGLEG